MLSKLLLLIKDLPHEAITLIIAALPLAELRGSIPVALLTLKEPIAKTFILSVIGNLLPIIPFLLLLEPLSEKLRHFRLWRNFFDYLFEQTKKKAALIEKYEAVGLMLFVAVPLPMTGAWSGCIAASLFKIRFRYALLAITLGVIIAGVIVTAVTLIGKGIFIKLFLAPTA
ncbi:MAG: small multi-drug export protein [Candidatus Omnitrophota bacterium]